jgi:hypothetical protein
MPTLRLDFFLLFSFYFCKKEENNKSCEPEYLDLTRDGKLHTIVYIHLLFCVHHQQHIYLICVFFLLACFIPNNLSVCTYARIYEYHCFFFFFFLPFLIFVEKLEAFQIFSITVDQFFLNICRDKSGGKFFSHNFWDKNRRKLLC